MRALTILSTRIQHSTGNLNTEIELAVWHVAQACGVADRQARDLHKLLEAMLLARNDP